jgi:hypothetical protein
MGEPSGSMCFLMQGEVQKHRRKRKKKYKEKLCRMQTAALPLYWAERNNGCQPPRKGYKGHGDVVPDVKIVWRATNSTGGTVSRWGIGNHHIFVKAYQSTANAWVYADYGATCC